MTKISWRDVIAVDFAFGSLWTELYGANTDVQSIRDSCTRLDLSGVKFTDLVAHPPLPGARGLKLYSHWQSTIAMWQIDGSNTSPWRNSHQEAWKIKIDGDAMAVAHVQCDKGINGKTYAPFNCWTIILLSKRVHSMSNFYYRKMKSAQRVKGQKWDL